MKHKNCALKATLVKRSKNALQRNDNGEKSESNWQIIQHTNKVSKRIYADFTQRGLQENPCGIIWAQELGVKLQVADWQRLMRYVYKITLSTKLRLFQYRLLNKNIMTNLKRSKWDTEVSLLCTFCHETLETTLHILWDCVKIQKLGKTLQRWLKYMLRIDITFTGDMIMYNNYKGPCKDLLNSIILIVKQYMYREKCTKQLLNFVNMLQNVYQTESVEYIIAKQMNCLYKHQLKWHSFSHL